MVKRTEGGSTGSLRATAKTAEIAGAGALSKGNGCHRSRVEEDPGGPGWGEGLKLEPEGSLA